MRMLWFRRLICEHFGCSKPNGVPYKVTQEDDQAACVEWTCQRCGEVVTALRLKVSLTRHLAERARAVQRQHEVEPVDGQMAEDLPPRLKKRKRHG